MNRTEYQPIKPTEGPEFTSIVQASEPQGLHETWYKTSRSRGWRAGVFYAATGTTVVFLLNLTITIWALTTHEITFGSGLLYEGSCSTTKNLNIGVHLVINGFSSIILSGSNYAMQCLSAPTRSEVDDAHASGRWLDIGVPSIRNLRRIAKKRKWLWLLLGLSSLPLHLFYNSVVFTTLSANEYRVYVINEAWLFAGSAAPMPDVSAALAERLYDGVKSGNLDRFEPIECIDAYSRAFVSTRSNLLVVTVDNSDTPEDPGLFDILSGGGIHITGSMDAVNLDPYPWICGDSSYDRETFCDVDALGVRESRSNWTLGGRTVNYCFSQPEEEHCKLQLSATIAVLVTVLNFVKVVLIYFVCFRIKEEPLMNIGDAVASFLERPDIVTEGSCLLSRADANRKGDHTKLWGPRPFHDERKRWFAASSRRRRLTVYLTSFLGLVVCALFLIYGLLKMPGASPSAIWSLGFGEATEHTLMTFQGIRRRMIRTAGTLNNVLIANSGQTILSFLYFASNGLLTSMLLSHEWSSYAHTRKGLRVSSSLQGHQRTTYFLQLPWRYAIPLVLSGTLLHWLGSQSIFLVTVEQWTNDVDTGAYIHDDFHDFATCGYSPLALFIFIIVGAALLLASLAMGFRKFKSGMPVASSCSLAIAAACHPRIREEPKPIAQLPLQWGVVGGIAEGGAVLWRCAFSSQDVVCPEGGTVYG